PVRRATSHEFLSCDSSCFCSWFAPPGPDIWAWHLRLLGQMTPAGAPSPSPHCRANSQPSTPTEGRGRCLLLPSPLPRGWLVRRTLGRPLVDRGLGSYRCRWDRSGRREPSHPVGTTGRAVIASG